MIPLEGKCGCERVRLNETFRRVFLRGGPIAFRSWRRSTLSALYTAVLYNDARFLRS